MAESYAQAAELVLDLLVQFEGLYLEPYLCPAGVATIGLGSTRYADGSPVRLTDPPISAAHARNLAKLWLAKEVFPSVRALCPGLSVAQSVAALADFVYNLGRGSLAGSTLRRRINEGDLEGSIAELARWVRGGGRVLPGLVRRRGAEGVLLRAGGVVRVHP